jgi:Domain of unknown function (DUF4372)/Transposase DDE domain
MLTERSVFSQLMDFLPKDQFDRCIERYHGNRRVRNFSCLDQFLCLAFAQLTYRESLRDIETCLRAIHKKLYHAGFRGSIARNTLAKASEQRDWRIYADLAQVLIAHARRLDTAEGFGIELEQTAYALDSTTIDLCLALFPWARFRRRKGAVKLHTLLDLRGNIPCFVRITHGKAHDVTALDALPIEAGSFYVMDRGYLDFRRLRRVTLGLAFFVIRGKKDLDYSRRSYRRVDKTTGLRSDQTIVLNGPKTSKAYPAPLRRVAYCDPETKKRFVFLTNNLQLPALTIAQIYKSRWQIELFFRWIKQHLRIKSFYGTSPNAVRTQVWIAVCVYVLVAIVRKELKLERSMGEILQILSISLFEKTPIPEALSLPKPGFGGTTSHNQLPLFDF